MSLTRQDIINAIQTRFQNILTPTYHTNLGSNVFGWRTSAVESQLLPCVIIRDASNIFELEETSVISVYTQTLQVEIEVICASGTTSADTVRQMIADVYKAIGQDDTWGGKAITTRAVSDEIVIQQQDKTIGGAIIKIEIQWRTRKWMEN